MPIFYASIHALENHGSKLIGHFPPKELQLKSICDSFIPKIDSRDHTKVIKEDQYDYCILVSRGVLCMAVKDKKFPLRIVIRFLNAINTEYQRDPDGINVVSVLKTQMKIFNDRKNDKITSISNKIEENRDMLVDSIQKALEQGDDVELLADKVEIINNTTYGFARRANKLKNQNRLKVILVIVCVISLILFALLMAGATAFVVICVLPTFGNKCFASNNDSNQPQPTPDPQPDPSSITSTRTSIVNLIPI